MAHSNNTISKIQLPGSEIIYQIHDEHAIHDADFASAMEFKGSVGTYDGLPTNPENGDVYLVTSNGNEYVWGNTSAPDTEESEKVYGWIELGTPLAADHTHSLSGSTGKQNTNTVTGTVTIPTISSTVKYLGASVSHGTNGTDKVLGIDTTFTTTPTVNKTTKYVGASASGTAVGENGTAEAVTGYPSPSTSTFIKTVTPTEASVIGSVDPTTASAITALGTPTTGQFLTGLGTASTSKALTSLGTPTTISPFVGISQTTPPPTDTFVKSYPGESNKLVTTSIAGVSGSTTASKVSSTSLKLDRISVVPAVSNGTAIKTVTPTTGSITGVSGSTTASKATAGTAVAVAKAGTAKSIPNVTGNTSVTASKVSNLAQRTIPNVTNVGTASTWFFKVENGTLIITGANSSVPTLGEAISATYLTATDVTATKTTLGTAISVTPAVSNGNITPYTFADVTVPVANGTASTFVTDIETTTTNVAKAGTAVTVADGTVSADGTGDSVITSVTATDVTVPKAASAKTVATGSVASTGTGASILVGLGDADTGTAITGLVAGNFATDTAIKSITPSSSSFVTSYGAPTKAAAITAVGTPTTSAFVTGLGEEEAEVVGSVATTSGSAVTGLGTPTTETVLTGVKVTAQPTISLSEYDSTATGRVQHIKDVSATATTTAGTNDQVTAVTSVGAPTVTLNSNDGSGTGRIKYTEVVTTGSTTAALQSGKVADHTHSFSGTTGAPN